MNHPIAPAQRLIVIDPAVGVHPIAASPEDEIVVILTPAQDGISQISEILQANPSITTLHIIAPAAPGCLQLGSVQLSLETLDRYAWTLQAWFSSSPHFVVPVLVLHGCDVAAGAAGEEFLKRLRDLTGAEITAFIHPTDKSGLNHIGNQK